MRKIYRLLVVLFLMTTLNPAFAEKRISSAPGLEPYIPTRIEWLSLVCSTQLNQDYTADNQFSLNVVNSDHETLLIFVRYHPEVNREAMNVAIDGARRVINITAKSYGWEKWLKVKERVEMIKRKQD